MALSWGHLQGASSIVGMKITWNNDIKGTKVFYSYANCALVTVL